MSSMELKTEQQTETLKIRPSVAQKLRILKAQDFNKLNTSEVLLNLINNYQNKNDQN